MKDLKKIIFILILFMFCTNVYSIGMTVPSQTKFYFEPNFKIEIPYMILSNGGSQYIELNLDGDLAQYGALSEKRFWLESRENHNVKMIIQLPAELSPGTHSIAMVATEAGTSDDSVGVSARTAVRNTISIFVPYPEDYVTSTIKQLMIEKGDVCSFETYIQNLGNKNNNVIFKIQILDENNNVMINKMPNPYEISVNKETHKNIALTIDECSSLTPGIYAVKTAYTYAGETKEISSELKVGSFDISILDHTKKIKKDNIEKVSIDIKSIWNEPIKNVVLRLTLYNNSKELTYSETAPFDINRWSTVSKNLFIDSPNAIGNYSAKIELIYPNENNQKITVEKDITIEVYEQKKAFNLIGMATSKQGSYVLGAIIVFIGIIYISYHLGKTNVKGMKKKKKVTKRK